MDLPRPRSDLTSFLYRLPHLIWRLAASLFAGLGCGLLSGGLLLSLLNSSPSSHEMAALISVGAGFLAAALTAYVLFFGPLSAAEQRRRQESAVLRATQVWEDASGSVESTNRHKVPQGLIVAGIVLGLIPLGLVAFWSRHAVEVHGVPRIVPHRTFGGFHQCSEPGCRMPATVFISRETRAGSDTYEHQDYCHAHAQRSAWEAQQKNGRYAVFDINTGAKRLDFEQFDRKSGITELH